ncbi:unnamed protein product [Rotaria magnacalcarata]
MASYLNVAEEQQDDRTEADTTNTFSSTALGKEAKDGSTASSSETGIQPASAKSLNQKLRDLANRHEIQFKGIKCLCKLENFKIAILCDDSGSMSEYVDGSQRTRWDELRDIVTLVIKIGCIFDSEGVDVYFLNRPGKFTIKDPNDVNDIFAENPDGYTPLVRSLRRIFRLPEALGSSRRKLLLFIATDGNPTDDDGRPNAEEFKHVMLHERQSETTHVSFLVCTDEPDSVDYLTCFDRTMKNIDVTDDYKTEKAKIRQYNGANFKFSKGDYIVKALAGVIDSETDQLNEPRIVNNSSS